MRSLRPNVIISLVEVLPDGAQREFSFTCQILKIHILSFISGSGIARFLSLSMEMSRLTRDGTAEPVSRDQILRHIHFHCSADDEQDCYPVDAYSYKQNTDWRKTTSF